MIDLLNLFYFVVAIVIILVVAQSIKKNDYKPPYYKPDESIIDVESTIINNDFSLIKSEPFKGGDMPAITEGSTSTKNTTVFQNTINFLNNDEVFLRYGKNKVEKDYQQDLEHRLAVLKERFGYNVIYEAKEGKHRIDFLIDNTVGIEMKVYRGGVQVEKDLLYQIPKYWRDYNLKGIIGLVLNDSDIENQQLKKEIEQILNDQNVLQRKDYEIIVKPIQNRY
jgi:hypothetical protein